MAVGQLADSHLRQVGPAQVFIPLQRAKQNSGIAVRQRQDLLALVEFVQNLLLVEDFAHRLDDDIVQHRVCRSAEQPSTIRVALRRQERLIAKSDCLSRTNWPRESFFWSLTPKEALLAW
jgi:hypothetical protein